MLSVSEVIEQLLVTNSKSIEESEVICECSLGKLHFNSVTNQKYESERDCTKKTVCYFVAVEKHKARTNTKEFLRHQKFNEQKNKTTQLDEKGPTQASLLKYLA